MAQLMEVERYIDDTDTDSWNIIIDQPVTTVQDGTSDQNNQSNESATNNQNAGRDENERHPKL